MTRIRYRGLHSPEVVATWVPPYGSGTADVQQHPWYEDYSEDELGSDTDHPLQITHRKWTSKPSSQKAIWEINSQPVSEGVIPGSLNPLALRDAVVNGVSTARILSASGPATAKVNTITNLLEIRDIPQMLKHAGDLLHKLVTRPSGLSPIREAASATLAYQFGWAPLAQDLSRMLDFADLVAARQRELETLYSGKGLRKKIPLGKYPSSASGNQPLYTAGALYIAPDWNYRAEHKLWATVHWHLRNLDSVGNKPTWRDAWRSVYGFSGNQIPVQIWKALPWSWAIDWFAGISDLLIALQNMVLFKPSRINLMCETSGVLTWVPYTTTPPGSFGGSVYEHIYRYREQRSIGSLATTNLRIPYLDTFKLSVLGSLLVLRL